MGMEEEAEARCSVSTISKDMYVLFEKSLSLSPRLLSYSRDVL